MSRPDPPRPPWSWVIAAACCLPLWGGCTPLDTDDLGQFGTDLLLNTAAALLL